MIEEKQSSLERLIRAEIVSSGMLDEELESLLCGRLITIAYAPDSDENNDEYFNRVYSEIMIDYIAMISLSKEK